MKYHAIHSHLKRIEACWISRLKIWVWLSVGIAYDHEIIQQKHSVILLSFQKNPLEIALFSFNYICGISLNILRFQQLIHVH